jgi:hypothetical protein
VRRGRPGAAAADEGRLRQARKDRVVRAVRCHCHATLFVRCRNLPTTRNVSFSFTFYLFMCLYISFLGTFLSFFSLLGILEFGRLYCNDCTPVHDIERHIFPLFAKYPCEEWYECSPK